MMTPRHFFHRTHLWRGDWLGREEQEWPDERRLLRYTHVPSSFSHSFICTATWALHQPVPSTVCVVYQMQCQVQPRSPPQPMTSRPCPRSTPWPPTQTAAVSTHWRGRWTRVSEQKHVCLKQPATNPNLRKPTVNQLLSSVLFIPSFLIFDWLSSSFSSR